MALMPSCEEALRQLLEGHQRYLSGQSLHQHQVGVARAPSPIVSTRLRWFLDVRTHAFPRKSSSIKGLATCLWSGQPVTSRTTPCSVRSEYGLEELNIR